MKLFSSWQRDESKGGVDNFFFKLDSSTHLAILFPGRGYTTLGATLRFPSSLLRSKGANVLHVEYGYNRVEGFSDLPEEEQEAWLLEDSRATVDAALAKRDYEQITLIGKSLGTFALSLLLPQDERLRNANVVWLTPVFKHAPVLDNLRRCSQTSVFIIGSADPHYNEIYLEGRNAYVIKGANHALKIPNDPFASVEVLRDLLLRIDMFIAKT